MVAPYGALFGRRIRVTVGSQVVCDVNPNRPGNDDGEGDIGRSLDVEFVTESHAKPEPLKTELVIYGLNRQVRDIMSSQLEVARREAWQAYQTVLNNEVLVEFGEEQAAAEGLVTQGASIIIEAGYGLDFGILARAVILPDGLRHERTQSGWVTEITAQDGRLPWSNAFVSEPVAPGVTVTDYQKVLAINEQFVSGDIGSEEVIAQGLASLVQRKPFPGTANGQVLHGRTSDESKTIQESLGIRALWRDGKLLWVPAGIAEDPIAVVLQLTPEFEEQSAPGGLLSYQELPRGFLDVHCLLNYRLGAGKQVQVLDEFGVPVGSGLFRVEHASHRGTVASQDFYTDAILRPVSIPPANNN